MTSLVETLAAIPSVVIGLWGIYVLGPILSQHVEPALHSVARLHPALRPASSSGPSIFTAIVVLTMMILPIVASIIRELFLGVPRELKEGALALGTTRWEMVRGVMFPYARGGIAAALILGLGRAVGEAIAVTQVIGGGVFIHWNIFSTGDTLASKIATSYQGAATNLEEHSLDLPRADPARLLARCERLGAVDRPPRRATAGRRSQSRRRSDEHARHHARGRTRGQPAAPSRVEPLMEVLAWLAAAIAVGFLVLIVWSVARKGASELNLDLITKTPAVGFLTTQRRGPRERVRGHARASSPSRR